VAEFPRVSRWRPRWLLLGLIALVAVLVTAGVSQSVGAAVTHGQPPLVSYAYDVTSTTYDDPSPLVQAYGNLWRESDEVDPSAAPTGTALDAQRTLVSPSRFVVA
jgi:hypothetical protein